MSQPNEMFHPAAVIAAFEPVKIDEELYNMYTDARTNVVLGSALYAYTMTKVEFIFSEKIETACAIVVPGKNIIVFGVDFFRNKLKNANERAFVVMHELDHIFFGHSQRAHDQGLNHTLFGIAADYYINMRCSGWWRDENNVIQKAKKYETYFSFPQFGGLLDEKYLGMSVDEIYTSLLEDMPEDVKQAMAIMGNGSFDDLSDEDKEKVKKLLNFDELPISKSAPEDSEALRAQHEENMATLQTAATIAEANNAIGQNEGNIVSMIREMAKPVISWTDRLTSLIQCSVRVNPTYKRANSRTIPGRGPVFPSYDGISVGVVYGFDTSGSMSQSDYAYVSSELKGIIEQFDAWKLNLVCCDMKLYELGEYSSEDISDFDDIEMTIKGGGGTDMSPIARFAAERYEAGDEVNACIIVTDGYIDPETLDAACHEDMTNIVLVTTPDVDLKLKNAEVINVPRMQQ